MFIMTENGWRKFYNPVSTTNRPIPRSWLAYSKHATVEAYLAWCEDEIIGSQIARGVRKRPDDKDFPLDEED